MVPSIIGCNKVCTLCGGTSFKAAYAILLSGNFSKLPSKVAKERDGDHLPPSPHPPAGFCIIVSETSKSGSLVASNR